MRLSLLLSLLLHSLAVSSLKPPSVASLLQQNSGVSLVNVTTTTTNVTTTAPAANINLAATIEEGLRMVSSDDRFHGAKLIEVWIVGTRTLYPIPTSLLDFNSFKTTFLHDGRYVHLDYIDRDGGNPWDGPRWGTQCGSDIQEMQWAELQSLVSLDEADRLMTRAGLGGRHIRYVIIDNEWDAGYEYLFVYRHPDQMVHLDALTREITVHPPDSEQIVHD